jgi:hypothetical protein
MRQDLSPSNFFTFVRTTVAKLPMVGVIKEIQNQISQIKFAYFKIGGKIE